MWMLFSAVSLTVCSAGMFYLNIMHKSSCEEKFATFVVIATAAFMWTLV